MTATSSRVMEHFTDPKQAILDEIGDISDLSLYHNQVLCAIYMRPEKTKSGIILPEQHRQEDEHQGKVGLVIQLGPDAFKDPENKWFQGVKTPEVNDWVVFRPSDGWLVTVNEFRCRILDDTKIRGKVSHPDTVW